MASGYGLTGGNVLINLLPLLSSWNLQEPQSALCSSLTPLIYPSGVSRCFPFWQEYLACYIVNQNEEPKQSKSCAPVLEDYYECLHHRKEVSEESYIPVD